MEAVISGAARQILDWLDADPMRVKGEFVLLAAGAEDAPEPVEGVDVEILLQALSEELSPAKAAKVAAKVTGLDRKTLYRRVSLGH